MFPADDEDGPQTPQQPFDPTKADRDAKAILAQGGTQHDVDTYLANTYGLVAKEAPLRAPVPFNQRVASDATSALPRNRPNATGDLQSTIANPGQQARFVGQVAASHALNAAQGIPGMEAVEAYAGSKLTGQPYAQSLQDLRNRVQRDVGDTPITTIEQMGGAAPLAFLKPLRALSGAKQAMTLAAADRMLQADPDKGIGQRATEAAFAVPVAGTIGKLADLGITSVAAARTPSPQANILRRQADRAASASRLFGAAQQEGETNGATYAVRQFIQEPEIAQRIQALQSLEQYKNTPADSPEMMRALARSMSDEANTLEKGLAVTDPSKPNTLRDKAKSLSALKKRLIDVVSNPSEKPPITLDVAPETFETEPQFTRGTPYRQGPVTGKPLAETTTPPSDPTLRQALRDFPEPAIPTRTQGPGGPAFQLREQPERMVTPGVRIETPGMRVQTAPAEPEAAMMPSFREASEDFARRSSEMEALRKGMFALQGESNTQRPTPNNIVAKNPKTRESLVDFVRTGGAKNGPITPGELQAVREGILGDLSNAWRYEKQGLFARPYLHDASVASQLLRSVPDRGQSATDLMKSLGLLSLNAPFANR